MTPYAHLSCYDGCIQLLTHFKSSDTAPAELVAVVDDLLNQLSSKFSNLSSELIGKSMALLSNVVA